MPKFDIKVSADNARRWRERQAKLGNRLTYKIRCIKEDLRIALRYVIRPKSRANKLAWAIVEQTATEQEKQEVLNALASCRQLGYNVTRADGADLSALAVSGDLDDSSTVDVPDVPKPPTAT